MGARLNLFARGVTLAVAVLVVAWSAILLADTHKEKQALTSVNSQPSVATFRKTLNELSDATLLNADRTPEIYRAGVELLAGERRQALADADRVAAAEPDNFAAWRMVALSAKGIAPERERVAQAHIAAMDPLSAR